MSKNNYKKEIWLVAIFVATTVFIAVTLNNLYLALGGVILGIIIKIVVKKRSKKVLVDERQRFIGGKATTFTLSFNTFIIAITSLCLIIIGRQIESELIEQIGIVLNVIACANLLVYTLAYRYYLNK